MSTCPNGHRSATDDWCEVCGHRMSAPPAQAPSAAGQVGQGPSPVYDPDATAAAELCPSCATPREGGAMFCEECRYNFRTHSATTYVATPPSAPPLPPYQGYEPSQRSRPSQVNRPAEPLAPEAVTSDSGDFLLPPPLAPSAPAAPRPALPGPAAPMSPAVPSPEAALSAQVASTTAHAVPTTVSGPSAGSGPSTASPAVPASPVAPSAPAAEGWTAVVAADRAYYTAMMARSGPDAGGLYFPQFSPAHQVPLTGNRITIGRRRHSTGVAPDIDLSRSPEDPGVSHQHAVLVQQPDGTWSVVDQDSTNGTTVNDGEDPIQPHLPVPLRDGDRVHVGAWTTITIHRG